MIKQISLGFAVAAALTGCGGSDSDSSSGGGAKTFSISDYTPVANSTSLTGTWVGVNNYSVSGTEDGVSGTRTVSQKRYFTIFENTNAQGLYYSVCDSSSSVFQDNSSNQPEIFGEQPTITDNNTMTVSVDYSSRIENWDFVKVSENTDGLGSVAVNWTGNTSNTDTTYDALTVCEKYETESGGGFTEIGHYFTLNFANSITDSTSHSRTHDFEAYMDLVDDGYDFINTHIENDWVTPSQFGNDTVNISVSENTSNTLTATFTGTDNNNGISFVIDAQINLNNQ